MYKYTKNIKYLPQGLYKKQYIIQKTLISATQIAQKTKNYTKKH